MSTREQVQAANAVAIRTFFSNAYGGEDKLYAQLSEGDGDQNIEDFLVQNGCDELCVWRPLDSMDVDYMRGCVDDLAQDILATMT